MSDQPAIIIDTAAAIPLPAVLQFEEIRQSAETNMLDISRVQAIASRRDMHELVILCENHDKYLRMLDNFGDLLEAAQAEQARQRQPCQQQGDNLLDEPPIADGDTQPAAPVDVDAPEQSAEFDGLPDLRLHAERLHEQRQTVNEMQDIYDGALDDFREENHMLIDALQEAKDDLAEEEALAREASLAHFEVTGNKSLDYGFAVAERTIHNVADADAIAYCINHNLPGALKLDKRAFMKLLNSGVITSTELTVETTKEAYAKLPGDLGKFLGNEGQ